ncbi:TLD-domain containing nucleolar protein [Wolffia australiana]
MGASSSVNKPSPAAVEEESIAASTGSHSMLRRVFSKLSAPGTNEIPRKSLQDTFSLSVENLQVEVSPMPEKFREILASLGPSIVDLFFNRGKENITWADFLRGYNRCCGRISLSASIHDLYRLYSALVKDNDLISGPSLEDDDLDSVKLTGKLKLVDVLMLLWICWIMVQSTKITKVCKRSSYVLPDLRPLITSAYVSSGEIGDDQTLDLENEISLQKLHMWILATVPGLSHCFTQYIKDRLHIYIASKEEDEVGPSSSSVDESTSATVSENSLLTCGRAWAISLSSRDTVSEELSRACFQEKSSETFNNLLYRSKFHGKGLSRFWSNVEGYHGPILLLLSIRPPEPTNPEGSQSKHIIGILTAQGFENRDVFYGDHGYLYSLSPVFRIFSPSGKDENFVYSRLHPSVRRYDPHPKPIGLGFGGTVRNERIFIEEDFSKAIIRHHAMDKTYKPGPLFPNQGFLPVEAFILELEAWGLGGSAVMDQQKAYRKREELFSEQRRKVDLKTFASWEDSPEKMMMSMITDPNRVQREDR